MKKLLLSLLLSYPLFINAEMPSVELISELELPGDSWHQAQDMIVQNDLVYLTASDRSNNPSLLIYDVTDHSNPILAGNYSIDFSNAVDPGDAIKSNVSYSSWALPRLLQMTLEYPNLYIPFRNGFEVVDISNPNSPQQAGQYLHQEPLGGSVQVHHETVLYVNGQTFEVLIKNDGDEYVSQSNLILDQNIYRTEYATDLIWDGGMVAYVLMQDYSRRPGQTHRS